MAGDDQAQNVSPKNRALRIGNHWPVRVAIGRDDRVEAPFARPALNERDIFRSMRFGVDRDEAVGAGEGDHIGAEASEDVAETVAGDRALFVKPDDQAVQSRAAEKVRIALAIGLKRRRARLFDAGQVESGFALSDIGRQGLMGRPDAGFVAFRDLAGRHVEFQAVAIVGNVAARDHDGAPAPRHRGHGKGRRRQGAAGHRRHAGILDRARDAPRDRRARRAQILADEDRSAPPLARGFEMGEEGAGPRIGRRRIEIGDEAAKAAGSKLQRVHCANFHDGLADAPRSGAPRFAFFVTVIGAGEKMRGALARVNGRDIGTSALATGPDQPSRLVGRGRSCDRSSSWCTRFFVSFPIGKMASKARRRMFSDILIGMVISFLLAGVLFAGVDYEIHHAAYRGSAHVVVPDWEHPSHG